MLPESDFCRLGKVTPQNSKFMFRLRRSAPPHDYEVDILGGAAGLNYAFDYRDVDGIMFPTKRKVYAWEGDYQIVKEPLLVSIEIGEITLR